MVTLYRPSSTKVAEVWTFETVKPIVVAHGTAGPATASPADKVTIAFNKVTGAFYGSTGSVVSTYCFNVLTTESCA